ncbi:MAG TPA: hypothetical protein VF758_08210 [Candidatus Acidoferrum sp.]
MPAELSRFFDALQQSIQFPAPRTESHLLPLLPQSTISYAAIPNYGDVAAQTLKAFRHERQESSVLRDWWEHGQLAATGPKIEDSLDVFSQLHQYLGDEIVLSAGKRGRESTFLLVSEIRKPGLKEFLQRVAAQFAGKSEPAVRTFDKQELAVAKDKGPGGGLVVLVRPDYVVASFDLATLRSFNSLLDSKSRQFASTPFGERILQEYQGGVTVMAAADLHKILDDFSPASKQSAASQYSGFADVRYLFWDHKTIAGKPVSQMELSFSSPRHGAASWLANPTPLGSLDFVSPEAIMAGTLVLSDPAQIFEEAKELASLSKSNAFVAIPSLEQALNLSLKNDLLKLLGGELTVELDSVSSSRAAWTATIGVKDANHLQQTLNTLAGAARLQANHTDDGGITYYAVQIPSAKTPTEIAYAFVDGYMVAGPTRDAVAEAVERHHSGKSLGNSQKFLAALPPGHPLQASALLYENPVAMAALQLQSRLPEFAASLAPYWRGATPEVIRVYGEKTAIREVSSSSAFDVTGILVGAAIAIPNLLRSKMAANEASAVGSVRTVNTAQITYQATYPQRGFAPDLASLGPNSRGTNTYSADHAGLIDESLANSGCTVNAWCTKSGFNFMVSAVCKKQRCSDYVVVATPVSPNTGVRSFCATSDGLIRFRAGPALSSPLSISECKGWPPIQ